MREEHQAALAGPERGTFAIFDRQFWLDALAGDVDEDFVSAVGEQTEATERPGLAKVFR